MWAADGIDQLVPDLHAVACGSCSAMRHCLVCSQAQLGVPWFIAPPLRHDLVPSKQSHSQSLAVFGTVVGAMGLHASTVPCLPQPNTTPRMRAMLLVAWREQY